MNLPIKESVINHASNSSVATTVSGTHQRLNTSPYKTSVSFHHILSQHFGCSIWLKWESENPTGTHKDRESAQIISSCLKNKLVGVGCASTGNFAISLAYHAQQATIPCEVWLPHSRSLQSVANRLQALGAIVNYVEGDLSDAYTISSRELDRRGFLNANPGQCSDKITAHETLSKEILSQVPNVTHVICPINNGSLFLGIASGFEGKSVKLIGSYTYSQYASSISGFNRAEGIDLIAQKTSACQGFLLEASEQGLWYGTTILLGSQSNTEVSSASVIGVLSQLKFEPNDVICCLITSNGVNKPEESGKLIRHFNKESLDTADRAKKL